MNRLNRWRESRWLRAGVTTLVTLTWLCCHGVTEDRAGEYPDAISQLLRDARIATDARFDAWKVENRKSDRLVAPDTLRRLLLHRSLQTNFRFDLVFESRDDCLEIRWTGSLRIAGNLKEARAVFLEVVNEIGMADAGDDLRSSLKVEYEKMRKLSGASHETLTAQGFFRRAGDVREELLVLNFGQLVGSQEPVCGVSFQFATRLPYQGPAPTTDALWMSLPALSPGHAETILLRAIAPKRVFRFNNDQVRHTPGGGINTGWSAELLTSNRAQVEDALREAGFVPLRESEWPNQKGRVQQDWSRESDATYAAIVTTTGSDRMRVQCQTPQRPR